MESELKLMSQLHSELVEMAESVAKYFSSSMLVSGAGHLIRFASNSYKTYLIIAAGPDVWSFIDVWCMLMQIFWINFQIFEIYFLCSFADRLSNQVASTRRKGLKMYLETFALHFFRQKEQDL